MDTIKISQFIKQEAKSLGFSFCGISKAGYLSKEKEQLEKWLKDNNHGTMSYMERNIEKRVDPRLLVDNAKSVISFLLNYYPSSENTIKNGLKISRYAYGTDYHYVIKEKLNDMVQTLKDKYGSNSRVFVDSAPVMDKVWAQRSGLGWIGKNTCLINKKQGSYFFIAEIVTDLELEYDISEKNHCGECRKCIDACPTGAIVSPYIIDSRKCISYLTIENKDEISEEFEGKLENWIFGCDICQEVCPWNKFAKPHNEPMFELNKEILSFKEEDWVNLEEKTFNRLLKKMPVQRTGINNLKRNINYIMKT